MQFQYRIAQGTRHPSLRKRRSNRPDHDRIVRHGTPAHDEALICANLRNLWIECLPAFSDDQQVARFGPGHGGNRNAFIESDQSPLVRCGKPQQINISHLAAPVNPVCHEMRGVAQAQIIGPKFMVALRDKVLQQPD